MSRRRRGREPLWARLAAIAGAALVAALLVALVVRAFSGALGLTRPRAVGESDPQFAEPAETVTRPPELIGDGVYSQSVEDPSAGWEQDVQTPVDKTADELTREAETAQ